MYTLACTGIGSEIDWQFSLTEQASHSDINDSLELPDILGESCRTQGASNSEIDISIIDEMNVLTLTPTTNTNNTSQEVLFIYISSNSTITLLTVGLTSGLG